VKILFDSNIHGSDAIFGGVAERAVDLTLEARWKIFICDTILTEVHRVLREKFNRSRAFAAATVQTLRDTTTIADEPISRHRVEGDLVTGDARLLALNPVEGVQIVNLAEYLRVLQDHGFAAP
jgi:predicted nucleic acid-binding protein